jgi:small glutamine-rich tetratricopeptide repeat-containing protein alpha
LDATNPIFYCNRAAAYSRIGEFQKAVDDCNKAIRFDPKYGKGKNSFIQLISMRKSRTTSFITAYGRLGLAYSKMNKHEEAIEAYRTALQIEPDNQDYKNNMEVTQQRVLEQNEAGPAGVPNLGGIDFAAALNNPQLVNMATRMMTDPSIQNMLGQLGGMNNVDALLETGRQLAMRMSNENPELFAQIRQQMMDQNGDPINPDGNEQDPNNPPPPQQ